MYTQAPHLARSCNGTVDVPKNNGTWYEMWFLLRWVNLLEMVFTYDIYVEENRFWLGEVLYLYCDWLRK
jgi:hypothetical protein